MQRDVANGGRLLAVGVHVVARNAVALGALLAHYVVRAVDDLVAVALDAMIWAAMGRRRGGGVCACEHACVRVRAGGGRGGRFEAWRGVRGSIGRCAAQQLSFWHRAGGVC